MKTRNYYPNIKKIIEKNTSFANLAKNKVYYSELAEIYEAASSRNKHTKKETRFLSKFFKKHCSGNKILDLACGVGRHSKPLAKMGFKTVGIDQSKTMLKIAKSKDKLTKYVLSDIRSFSVGKGFDAAFCLWTTYTYLSTKRDFERFLRCVYKALKPGGFLILESRNFFRKSPKLEFKRKLFKDKRFDVELFIRKRINLKNKIQDAVYVYFILNKKTGKTYSSIDTELVKIYSQRDIKNGIKGRFKIFKLLGEYDLHKEYKRDKSERLIFILQKKYLSKDK